MITKVKTEAEIKSMRESGRMLASVLALIKRTIEPGMTGKEVNQAAETELKKLGGKPAFKGYLDFPSSICISAGQAIVHGLPDKRPFEQGDLVGFDFGVNYRGMITDAAITIAVGGTKDKEALRLLNGTEESLMRGISVIKGPTKVGDISAAIEAVLVRHGFGIVRNLVGHGVGHHVHEEPNIPNYGKKGTGMELLPGMTVAIEPMATLGGDDVVLADDGWTIVSQDGSLTAHFEHTVLVTEGGHEILTKIADSS